MLREASEVVCPLVLGWLMCCALVCWLTMGFIAVFWLSLSARGPIGVSTHHSVLVPPHPAAPLPGLVLGWCQPAAAQAEGQRGRGEFVKPRACPSHEIQRVARRPCCVLG